MSKSVEKRIAAQKGEKVREVPFYPVLGPPGLQIQPPQPLAKAGETSAEFDARALLNKAKQSDLGWKSLTSQEVVKLLGLLDAKLSYENYAARAASGGQRDLQVEIELLRGRLRTIHLADTFGSGNEVVAKRLAELENLSDQARQYIQNAQQREHRISELEEKLAARAAAPELSEEQKAACERLLHEVKVYRIHADNAGDVTPSQFDKDIELVANALLRKAGGQ